MTEAEWLSCPDPMAMLASLPASVSERKLRLFALACCRRLPAHLADAPGRAVLETAERFADGEASAKGLLAVAFRVEGLDESAAETTPPPPWWQTVHAALGPPQAVSALAARVATAVFNEANDRQAVLRAPPHQEIEVSRATWAAAVAAGERERALQCAMLRDLVGHGAGPLDPGWLTPQVMLLARAAYLERILPSGELDPARLAVLADALEEAGCTDRATLDHLRDPGPHIRGCWALDLVLAKK